MGQSIAGKGKSNQNIAIFSSKSTFSLNLSHLLSKKKKKKKKKTTKKKKKKKKKKNNKKNNNKKKTKTVDWLLCYVFFNA